MNCIILSLYLYAARYLLYDINPPEGFNLRRDVYIRMASLVKTLRRHSDWVLVLPPWGRLYHWQSPDIHQTRIPWGEFFSLTSLQGNVPVIEYEEFIAGECSWAEVSCTVLAWLYIHHSYWDRAGKDIVECKYQRQHSNTLVNTTVWTTPQTFEYIYLLLWLVDFPWRLAPFHFLLLMFVPWV